MNNEYIDNIVRTKWTQKLKEIDKMNNQIKPMGEVEKNNKLNNTMKILILSKCLDSYCSKCVSKSCLHSDCIIKDGVNQVIKEIEKNESCVN